MRASAREKRCSVASSGASGAVAVVRADSNSSTSMKLCSYLRAHTAARSHIPGKVHVSESTAYVLDFRRIEFVYESVYTVL